MHARAPLARIAVRVLRANGQPAPGVVVHLAQGRTVESGWYQWHLSHFQRTDEVGEVVFHLHDESAFENKLVLTLRESLEGEVSDFLEIGPPLEEGPHELRLYPGGVLDVLVVDEGKLAGIVTDRDLRRPDVTPDADGWDDYVGALERLSKSGRAQEGVDAEMLGLIGMTSALVWSLVAEARNRSPEAADVETQRFACLHR